MKKTEMLKKNYEFKTVLSKGKFFIGKEIEIFLLNILQVQKIPIIFVTIKRTLFEHPSFRPIHTYISNTYIPLQHFQMNFSYQPLPFSRRTLYFCHFFTFYMYLNISLKKKKNGTKEEG